MSRKAEDRSRKVTVISYPCRSCGRMEVRHYFSVKDYEHDIIGQNRLCMRCYLDGKYEPGSLVPPEHLPVTPYPVPGVQQITNGEE